MEATSRQMPQSLGCCVPSLTARAAYQVQRLAKLVFAKNTPLSVFWKTSNPATSPLHRESTSRLISPKIPFVTPGDLKLPDATASGRKIQKTYRAVVKFLLKHKKHKPQVDILNNTHHK